MNGKRVKYERAPEFHFMVGKCYQIEVKPSGLPEVYVFRYERKQGIHHMFREVRGEWSRTYTDAQLIGKKIQEV